MNSYEFNKIAGATLTALLVTTVIGFIGSAIIHPLKLEKPVVVVEGVQEASTTAAPEKPEVIPPVGPLLAKADVAAGKATFKVCMTCHTDEKGGPNRIGPNLWGVVGRKKASEPGFSYSEAMKKFAADSKSPVWTFEEINDFVIHPQKTVPGTKMTFVGLKKADERANVIAYLRTQSDSPVPLPQ